MIKRLWRKLFGTPIEPTNRAALETAAKANLIGKMTRDIDRLRDETLSEHSCDAWTEPSCHSSIIIPRHSLVAIETEDNIIHVTINFALVNDEPYNENILSPLIAGLRLAFNVAVESWHINKNNKKGETDVVS